MSLAIDPEKVVEVLLADGWHRVLEFHVDAYEFVDGDDFVLHGGGRGGICSAGFSFRESDETWISGPLTALQAVRHHERSRHG